jgi:hypothetical protein
MLNFHNIHEIAAGPFSRHSAIERRVSEVSDPPRQAPRRGLSTTLGVFAQMWRAMITRGRMKMPEIAVVTGGSAGIGRATVLHWPATVKLVIA